VSRAFQSHQTLKVREQSKTATALGFENFFHRPANPAVVQQSFNQAQAK
jgi:hypothetical protein